MNPLEPTANDDAGARAKLYESNTEPVERGTISPSGVSLLHPTHSWSP